MSAPRWSQLARADLKAIHDHIATDSPANAKAVVRDILARAATLPDTPRIGRRVPELMNPTSAKSPRTPGVSSISRVATPCSSSRPSIAAASRRLRICAADPALHDPLGHNSQPQTTRRPGRLAGSTVRSSGESP